MNDGSSEAEKGSEPILFGTIIANYKKRPLFIFPFATVHRPGTVPVKAHIRFCSLDRGPQREFATPFAEIHPCSKQQWIV
jgi:hypothetical protein